MVFVMASRLPSPQSHVPVGEIGTNGCADAVGTVTARARRAGNFAGEDLPAERNLFTRSSWRHRKTGLGMNALRRQYLRRSGGLRCRSRGRLQSIRIGVAVESYAPDAALDVVRNVERAVRSDGKSRRPVGGPAWVFVDAGKSISEYDELAGCLAVRHRLENDGVSALRSRRAVPRPVEGDEGAAPIGFRELSRPCRS